jgi:hypothetical protein
VVVRELDRLAVMCAVVLGEMPVFALPQQVTLLAISSVMSLLCI